MYVAAFRVNVNRLKMIYLNLRKEVYLLNQFDILIMKTFLLNEDSLDN